MRQAISAERRRLTSVAYRELHAMPIAKLLIPNMRHLAMQRLRPVAADPIKRASVLRTPAYGTAFAPFERLQQDWHGRHALLM